MNCPSLPRYSTVACLFVLTAALPVTESRAAKAARPNILLMMVDDLGFSDFGCYGSEIETPAIDRLGREGLRFTQFYNTAKCHSSRVCLLSGKYCFQAGNQKLDRSTTIADDLKSSGYFTAMAGKWHLADEPTDRGFMRYWGHLSGATDFFAGDKTFRLNGEKWDDFDEDFYTTDANVDYAIRFIGEALEAKKPFFQYIAFNAPHYPLQAPKEDIRKYIGRYDAGWDKIRAARFAKQKDLGLFSGDLKLPPRPEHMVAWDDLGGKEKQWESFRMAIFAAMVDRIDQNLGRLRAFLEKEGQWNNTLVILCSDNGGCPFERSRNIDIPPWKAKSYYLYDASWATVSNTPLRHYKQNQYEGGISTPLIVHWPDGLKGAGSFVREPGHLIDIKTTCIDVAGAGVPEESRVKTPKSPPDRGKSLLPLIRGGGRESHEWLYFQFGTDRAIRKGDWKLVSFKGHAWELYNLAEDRFEQHNLAPKNTGKVKELSDLWHQVARDIDQAPQKMRKPVKDAPSPNANPTWHKPDEARDWTMPEF